MREEYALWAGLVAGVAALLLGLASPTIMPAHQQIENAAVVPIILDGRYDDWAGVSPAIRDPEDAQDADVDLGEVKVAASASSVSLLVDLRRAFEPSTRRDSWAILVDADANATTGIEHSGQSGVDAVVEFGAGTPPVIKRANGLAFDGPGPSIERAPGYAHRRWEVRIQREAAGLVSEIVTLRLVVTRENRLLDETSIVSLRLPSYEPDLPAPDAVGGSERDPLARDPAADIRVMGWNVFGLPDRWLGRDASLSPSAPSTEVFGRVVRALAPDVILLNEVAGEAAAVRGLLPVLDESDSWQVLGRGELVVIARTDQAIAEVFDRPSSTVAASYGSPGQLSSEVTRVTAMGTTVSVSPKQLLVVPLHLPCCRAEAERVRDASALAEAVRRSIATTDPAGVIVAGDFNTVGTRRPIDIIQSGITASGVPITVVEALQLDGLSNATYWNSRGPHPPGRLDWMLYSPSSLELTRAFVFEASDLAPKWLTAYGLEAGDSDVTRSSDHRPIVADFRWRR